MTKSSGGLKILTYRHIKKYMVLSKKPQNIFFGMYFYHSKKEDHRLKADTDYCEVLPFSYRLKAHKSKFAGLLKVKICHMDKRGRGLPISCFQTKQKGPRIKLQIKIISSFTLPHRFSRRKFMNSTWPAERLINITTVSQSSLLRGTFFL